MEDYTGAGGLGGLGGYLNSAATNPFILAGLQMLGNNTPQIGRIPNSFQGVPQTLFQAGEAQKKDIREQQASNDLAALYNSMNGDTSGRVTQPPVPTAAPATNQSSNSNQFDPTAVASSFKDLGATYGGMTIGDAAVKLGETNKTAAAQLINTAKQLNLPTDTQLTDQVIEDPNVGPKLMQAFMGQQYKLKPDQWAQVHSAWDGARQQQDQANAQGGAQPQQQPGPFDNAPTGTAQQAPGTAYVGPTPEQAAAAQQVRDAIAGRAQPQPPQQQPEQVDNTGGAPAQQPQQPRYTPPPNATMNQMPAGPTPQQQAIQRQAQTIMQPAAPAQQPPSQPAGPRFDQKAMARVLSNPNIAPGVKSALLEQANPKMQFVPQPDGTIVGINPRDGTAKVVYQGASKLTFGKIGSNLEGDVYGFIDAANHKTYDVNGNPIGNGGANGAGGVDISSAAGVGKHGQEYLDASVPEQYQELVKGIADYTVDPKTLPYRGEARTKLLIAAKNYDPSYDQKLYQSSQKAYNDFMSGNKNTPAGNLTSGMTAIEHLGRMDENSQKLGGVSRLGPLNAPANVANIAYKSLSNNPDLARYNQDLDRFVEEGTAFYRGIGGSESDIKRGLASITAAQSPEARSAAISEQAHLMAGKLLALEQRVKNAMGPGLWKKAMAENPEAALLTQRAHDILNRMNAHPSSKDISAADSQLGPPISEGWTKGTRPGYENYWFKPDPDRPGKFLQWQGKQ